ncbi:MAG: hypothetical protein CL902_11735 [Dehalococcoidia bacterium]|nr:hypothetical protein [Dehalococcoidia bacterium]
MVTDKETELHYFPLLKDIAAGEKQHGIYIQAWADKTQDPELKACLSMVADREFSHHHIFKRRISELGHTWVEASEDPVLEERLRVNGSDMPDVEKARFAKDKMAQRPSPTTRERCQAAMSDETVDSLTRSLLAWFSDVEVDSNFHLGQSYDRLEANLG